MEIVMFISDQYRDPRWQRLRLRVFERDGWKCRMCKQDGKTLHAHHPVYRAFSEGPWDYEVDELVTVCEDCHKEEHEIKNLGKSALLLEFVKQGVWSEEDFLQYSVLVERIDWKRSTPDQIVMRPECAEGLDK